MTYPKKQAPELWARQLDFAALERQHGLPFGILTNLVRQESSGDCEVLGPVTKTGERAKGLCQFMPKTAERFGVDRSNPASSIKGAARYLEYLIDYFGGDVEKGIAAYNWGEGNLGRMLRKHPDDWKHHLPDETKNYVAIVGRGIGKNYKARAASGESIPEEDRRAELSRRRSQLHSVGASTLLPEDQLLSNIFYGIFEMCAKCLALISDFISPDRSSEDALAMRSVRSVQASAMASRG